MRNAAHRRDSEVPPEPPSRDHLVADAVAGAAAWAERRNALIARLEAEPGNDRLINELVIANIRTAENTAALEDCTAGESVVEAVDRAAFARGWDAREAAGLRPSRPRHAGGKRHLSPVPGIPATAVRTAAVAAVAAVALSGGVVAGMHDESAVRAFAAGPFRHAALHRMAPDRASVVPSPRWSPSPRPSAAAASARPVPPSAPSPSGSPASSPPAPPVSPPPPPVTVPAGPVLVAPGLLDLGGSHFGQLPLSVEGPGEIAWTATTADGITLVPSAGVVVSGQPVEIQVDDPTGNGGWIYFSAGSQALAVHVMPSGAPAVALP